jgi:hypothetical protein
VRHLLPLLIEQAILGLETESVSQLRSRRESWVTERGYLVEKLIEDGASIIDVLCGRLAGDGTR